MLSIFIYFHYAYDIPLRLKIYITLMSFQYNNGTLLCYKVIFSKTELILT